MEAASVAALACLRDLINHRKGRPFASPIPEPDPQVFSIARFGDAQPAAVPAGRASLTLARDTPGRRPPASGSPDGMYTRLATPGVGGASSCGERRTAAGLKVPLPEPYLRLASSFAVPTDMSSETALLHAMGARRLMRSLG
jgi:hypothetical protein